MLAELRQRGLLDGDGGKLTHEPADTERQRSTELHDRQRRIAGALDLWGECHSAPGTIVERYWRSRGLTEPIPQIVRMHGPLRHREHGGRRPAMVALVEHVAQGVVGVHITYLAIDGSMQAAVDPRKRSLGPVGGGAVRLARVEPDRELVIAEGIETTASVMQATGLPGWAALSAGGMERVLLPPEARMVLICADSDANGTGERAARRATVRFTSEGRKVRLAMPPQGLDFNDLLMGRASRIPERAI